MNQEPRTVLITGGAQGIGKGIAAYLLHKGWRVVICDLDARAGQRCLEELEPTHRLLFIEADVAVEDEVKAAIRQATEWSGQLDALVNNAGIADPETGPIEELDLADWQRRLDVNLTGPFLMSKHAVPHLRKTRGSIVNMASSRAIQSEPNTEAYAATKGGIVALTHALAISLGPEIRVNAISPGWIDVRAWQVDAPAEVEPLSETDHNQHPAGRVGQPEDIASMVAYLISPEAGFMTGQNVVIDGGMTRKMIYEE
ncbi:SDR family oxidoreductase [Marinobacter nanhaiticus D15-8W]|uniref:SDR family oxidoreductase n=1 Tax=Marinobacter nanhaiticus D15-8W TaxID=626887 RepID=N6WWC9_9GAMM|nr:SDR family oxidoreductase [Marinobacter nanhaiticus]ENO15901.1 SDR family oxidoreductase [Marinobacter nanhaiticus D15-8W]BES73241.1 SDR family oxidoreductase [Marinobacter nanhaiticus D15-8W]